MVNIMDREVVECHHDQV